MKFNSKRDVMVLLTVTCIVMQPWLKVIFRFEKLQLNIFWCMIAVICFCIYIWYILSYVKYRKEKSGVIQRKECS